MLGIMFPGISVNVVNVVAINVVDVVDVCLVVVVYVVVVYIDVDVVVPPAAIVSPAIIPGRAQRNAGAEGEKSARGRRIIHCRIRVNRGAVNGGSAMITQALKTKAQMKVTQLMSAL
jgi:hypothetical protein